MFTSTSSFVRQYVPIVVATALLLSSFAVPVSASAENSPESQLSITAYQPDLPRDFSLVVYTANVRTDGQVREIEIYEGYKKIGSCVNTSSCTVRNSEREDYQLNGVHVSYRAVARGVRRDGQQFWLNTQASLVQVKPFILPDTSGPDEVKVYKSYVSETDSRRVGLTMNMLDENGTKNIQIFIDGEKKSECNNSVSCGVWNYDTAGKTSLVYFGRAEDVFGNRYETAPAIFQVSPADNANPTIEEVSVRQRENRAGVEFFVEAKDDYDVGTVDIFKDGELIKHCFHGLIAPEGYCFVQQQLRTDAPFQYYVVVKDHYGKEVRSEVKTFDPRAFDATRPAVRPAVTPTVQPAAVRPAVQLLSTDRPANHNRPVVQSGATIAQAQITALKKIESALKDFYRRTGKYPVGRGRIGVGHLGCLSNAGWLSVRDCERAGITTLPSGYRYFSAGDSYRLFFSLRTAVGKWRAGSHMLTPTVSVE